ncbi:hypothetical protein IIB50_02570 [Patescibacteria group bacterium]|nr:hypothetical protein [Patescibacteria group bacterium]
MGPTEKGTDNDGGGDSQIQLRPVLCDFGYDDESTNFIGDHAGVDQSECIDDDE